MKKNTICFYLNGTLCELAPELLPSSLMLADFLRRERMLTGTKVVCAEGDCGACTVLRFFNAPGTHNFRRKPHFETINACITPTALMHGSSLVTIEALNGALSVNKTPTPIQKAMIECHGSQCGFCTPGFVMALTGLVERKIIVNKTKTKALTENQTKNALTGNLCRCTGYQPIIDAATTIPLSKCESLEKTFATPEQRRVLQKILSEPIMSEPFSAPITLKEAVKVIKKGRQIVGAATDLGVVHNKGKSKLGSMLSLHLIPELYEIKKTKTTFHIGARVTLTELREAVKKEIPEFSKFLDLFASPQIKNTATLVGNVCNGSPIGDTLPFLLVTKAKVHVIGKTKRMIPFEKFYTGYRKNTLKAGEIVTAIEFEIPAQDELKLLKVSQRKDLDISTVSAAFNIKGSDVRIAFGGVAATPLRLLKTEKVIIKTFGSTNTKSFDQKQSFDKILTQFHSEITPLSDVRGSAAFRRVIAENILKSFLTENFPKKFPRDLP